jgi:hypothetical protein
MRFAWARGGASPSRYFDRKSVDPDLLREYDMFGPWIGEIRLAQDMPRRFRGHHAASAGARYLLKIPMELDRRTIVPGQDLYRAVLAVHEDHVRWFVLEGTSIAETRVDFPDVVAIENHTCLLLGIVRLHLANGDAFSLPYNTTSQPLVDGVIDFLRQQLSQGPMARLGAPHSAVADYYFLNLIAEQKRRSGPCNVVHCEVPGQVFTDARGHKRKANGLLAFDSGAELTFVVADKAVATGSELSYALDRTYVPRRAVQTHEVCEIRGRWGKSRRMLRLRASGGHILEFPMWGEGGPLRTILERLAAGQSRQTEGTTQPAA